MTCAGTLGKVAVVPQHFDKGIFNSVLMRFRCNEDVIIPEYLKLILQSNKMQGILVKDCIGVGIKNMIPTDELKEIRVPVPSKPEQQKIIDNIKEENKKIQTHLDNIASIKKKQKDLLNSFDFYLFCCSIVQWLISAFVCTLLSPILFLLLYYRIPLAICHLRFG